MARGLSHDWQFVFICLDERGPLADELEGEGFRVHALNRRPGLDWHCAWRLAGLFAEEQVRLVHAHQYTPFFWALTARLRRLSLPVLFTEHGRWHPDYPRRKRILANRLLLGRRDRIVGVGEAVRQALIKNEGLPLGRVEVVYNGVDLSVFDPPTLDRLAARRIMQVDDGDFAAVQVARLDDLKDHSTALRAVKRAAEHCPRLRLVVIGEGPEEPAIRRQVQDLGIDRFVRLLGLRKDVPSLLPSADVLLLSSKSEGIPLTVIEGMAARLPVVATNVGGLAEMVEEGATGFLSPAHDDEGLARSLLRLAGDPQLARRMGDAGHAVAWRKFSVEQMLEAYDVRYRQMLRLPSASQPEPVRP
jgi:glycosyltransferase involved in cell wall biosynthesis